MNLDLKKIKTDFMQLGYTTIHVPEITKELPKLLTIYENLILTSEHLGIIGDAKIRKSELVGMSGSGWSWGCDHIFSPLLHQQPLLDLVSLHPIPEIIHKILGERVRWTGGHGHWSPKTYDYYLHWHRDTRPHLWYKGNNDPACHIQICMALSSEKVIRIVPKSHMRNITPWEQRFLKEDKYDNHPYEITIHLEPGDLLFFNTYTLHRAYCSKDNIRRALHFGFTRVNSIPEDGRLGKSFDWLKNPDFFDKQSTFLQNCINEQVLFQESNSSLRNSI